MRGLVSRNVVWTSVSVLLVGAAVLGAYYASGNSKLATEEAALQKLIDALGNEATEAGSRRLNARLLQIANLDIPEDALTLERIDIAGPTETALASKLKSIARHDDLTFLSGNLNIEQRWRAGYRNRDRFTDPAYVWGFAHLIRAKDVLATSSCGESILHLAISLRISELLQRHPTTTALEYGLVLEEHCLKFLAKNFDRYARFDIKSVKELVNDQTYTISPIRVWTGEYVIGRYDLINENGWILSSDNTDDLFSKALHRRQVERAKKEYIDAFEGVLEELPQRYEELLGSAILESLHKRLTASSNASVHRLILRNSQSKILYEEHPRMWCRLLALRLGLRLLCEGSLAGNRRDISKQLKDWRLSVSTDGLSMDARLDSPRGGEKLFSFNLGPAEQL
jgi:hypothetical protein